MGNIKTFILMLLFVVIFMWIGNLVGGEEGMRTAFIMAFGMNFITYFFSDKMVLRQYRATKVTERTSPMLYNIVYRLSQQAGLPMPKVYIIPEKTPNAFATGRNPSHAAVAATEGLLNLMSEEEIEGVLAHEMSHVKHYDILTGTIAAVFAGAISLLGNASRYSQNRRSNSQKQGLIILLSVVLLPLAATIIRFSISRTREYAADEGAARMTGHPEWLMSALSKLEEYARQSPINRATNETAHLFIVNPVSHFQHGFSGLFSTHPKTEDRIARLAKIAHNL